MSDAGGRPAREDDESTSVGLGRVLAFSDGVFAIAGTLLVLNLDLPRGLSGRRLEHAVNIVLDDLISAVISFAVIGLFWLGHHYTWRRIRTADRRLLVINLAFLGPLVLVPFAAQVLSAYGDRPLAVISYAGLIVLAALAQMATWVHARDKGLLKPQVVGLERRYGYMGALVVAVVFLASMPVALIWPSQTPFVWLLAPPLMRVAVHRTILRSEGGPLSV